MIDYECPGYDREPEESTIVLYVDENLSLAENVHELPWFVEVLEQAKADLMATPDQSLPAWVREWKARQ